MSYTYYNSTGTGKHNYALLAFSTALYVAQGAYGFYIIMTESTHAIDQYWLMTLMLFLFSLALGRAWELTGIRKNTGRRVK